MQSFAGGDSAAVRPTIFIGLGGAATSILKGLRRRLAERAAEDGLPRSSTHERDVLAGPSCADDIKLLAIDTDRTSLQGAQEAEDGVALSADETLHLPLRKPSEYRRSSDEILSWLSRRWLYNIPRSLRTEGLRPLGRLAFVDHREIIADRLRRLLSDQPPRVFITASIDGGAGSGMLLDVAYAMRQQLDQLKLPTDCFCGVLLHATLAGCPSNDLHKANAYATLTELNHFMHGAATFRAGPVEVLPVGDVSEPPFHDVYLVRLGEELNPDEFDRSLGQVADYLYLNASCGAVALDRLRCESRQTTTADAPVRLRSFGLRALRVEKHVIAREEAERLCSRLVRSWSGEDTDESLARSRLQPPGFALDELLERVKSVADQALGGNADAHFRTVLISEAAAAPSRGDSSGRFGDLLWRVHAVLGTPLPSAENVPQSSRLESMLAAGAKKLAATMGDVLIVSIEALVDQPQARLPAALAGVNLYQQHLRELREAAEQIVERDLAQAQAVCARLERGSLPSERFWFSRLTTTNAVVEECLLAYCRSLLRLAVYKQVICCLQEMTAMLAALNERLLALRQSLRLLAEEFAQSATAADAPWAAECRVSEQDLSTESLLTLADDPQRWRELARQLRDSAHRAVFSALAGVDAGSQLLQQCPTDETLDRWFAAAASDAASALSPAGDNDSILIALPRGSNQERLAAAAKRCLPGSTMIVSDDSDLVVLREIGAIALAEAAAKITESRDACAEAARRVLTRVDVSWSPLAGQAVVPKLN